MKTSNRINSIDIVRLFAAILVIAIHTQAIMWFPSRANGNIQILTRVAVPFFFCTSGYFLQKSYISKDCSAIAGTLLKLIKVYVFVSLAYFSFIFLQNPILLHEPKKWMLVDFLFNGSYYHLWYMVGVIYSIAMIYMFCKLKLTKMLFPLAALCYAVGLLGTSYYGIGSRLPVLNTLFDSGWFLSIRRIFLMGFPFVALGWALSEGKMKFRPSLKQLLIATALTAVLFVIEIIVVTITNMSRTVEITVFLYPLLFLLFQVCLAYPAADKRKLASACRDTANFTYFWHPLFILALSRVIEVKFLLFVVTTVTSLFFGLCYHFLKKRKKVAHEHHTNF